VTFLPKVRLEFHAPPDTAEEAAAAVVEAARTGRIGDGKVFFLDETPR
jgi:nitrogen regulatory protein P-II 1